MLLTRNAGPPFDCGFDGAKACGMLNEPESGAHGVGRGGAATYVERDNRAEALELASCGFVSWMGKREHRAFGECRTAL